MKAKPKVGQKLFSLNINDAASNRPPVRPPLAVTKVGRKYFYCHSYLPWPNCHPGGRPGIPRRVYKQTTSSRVHTSNGSFTNGCDLSITPRIRMHGPTFSMRTHQAFPEKQTKPRLTNKTSCRTITSLVKPNW